MIHPARQIRYKELIDRLSDSMSRGLVIEKMGGKGLALYTYTKQCSFDKTWDDTTLMTRGLIVDHLAERVAATPFVKFFNYGERESGIPDKSFNVLEKVDGSMIIVFYHDGVWKTATKGSFGSRQAQWADQWLSKRSDRVFDALVPGWTYIFEAIYPENRIVVRYDEEQLVLLGGYTSEGLELTYDELVEISNRLGTRPARMFHFSSFSQLIETAKTLPRDKEGYILWFEDGYRLKIKGDEYCRIHRLISGVTPLAIWEMMYHGDDLNNIRKELPEEFQHDFDKIVLILSTKMDDIQASTEHVCKMLKGKEGKEIAALLPTLPEKVRPFVFMHLKYQGDYSQYTIEDGKFKPSKSRRALFHSVRPIANVLEGYEPSSVMNRFVEESS